MPQMIFNLDALVSKLKNRGPYLKSIEKSMLSQIQTADGAY